MAGTDNIREILERIPLEPGIIEEISTVGRYKRARKGDTVVSSGDNQGEVPLVLHGVLRVVRFDDNGKEFVLYFIGKGDTCAMSVTCCFESKPVDISLIAEEDVELWLFPLSYIDRWIEKYPSFRKFIFRSYQNRFDELLQALDNLAFLKLDERLINYLLDRKQAQGTYEIKLTHEEIARHLNTSRVVVSRLLKKLEKEGKIEMYRNRIEIL